MEQRFIVDVTEFDDFLGYSAVIMVIDEVIGDAVVKEGFTDKEKAHARYAELLKIYGDR